MGKSGRQWRRREAHTPSQREHTGTLQCMADKAVGEKGRKKRKKKKRKNDYYCCLYYYYY